MKKIAIIGDLVSSRELSSREELQEKLARNLNELNNTHKRDLISPYTLTLGDEFQAVYKSASMIFEGIFKLLNELYPVKIRFSLGIGEISTKINEKQAIGMDGPAFYFARDGINELKSTGDQIIVNSDDFLGYQLISKNMKLISHIIGKWSKNKFLILEHLIEGKTVAQISDLAGVTEQAIYKSIDTNGIKLIKELLDEISEYVNSNLETK